MNASNPAMKTCQRTSRNSFTRAVVIIIISMIVQSIGMLTITMSNVRAAERVALLVGNGDYVDKHAKLPNPTNDVKDLGNVLERIGFKVLLRQNLDANGMKDAVREFSKELNGASVALFFYAGHALQLQGINYLLPVNASPRNEGDVLLDAMDMGKIIYMMGNAKTRNIVILDACRDNPFKLQFPSSVGLAQMAAPPETLIAYSTSPGAVAYDGTGRNSIYTRHLLEFIKSPNDEAQRVFALVGEAVQKETRSAKPPQVPWQLSSMRPNFYIAASARGNVSNPSPFSGEGAPSPQASTQSSAQLSLDSQLNAERVYWESVDKKSVDDLKDYIQRFPNGLYASLANRQLAALGRETEKLPAPSAAVPKADSPATPLPAAKPAPPVGISNKPIPAIKAPEATVAAVPPAKTSTAPLATVAPHSTYPFSTLPAVGPGPARNLPGTSPSNGQIKFLDGSVYNGDLRNGQPNGSGEYVGIKGYRYRGNFVNGRQDGKGKAHWPDGWTYDGEFANERPNGIGTIRFPSGDVYEGQVKDGTPDGRGKLVAKSRDIYDGEFRNGQRHGVGELKFPDGGAYKGNFVNGVMVGQGQYRMPNGDVYEGRFKAGRYDGAGKLPMSSGDSYVGEFENGLYAGRGIYRFASGMSFDGAFVQGKANGAGTLVYVDGLRFEGAFRNGLENAIGVSIGPDGRRTPAEIDRGLLRPTN
jgi:uncharacterized caspase-like protein